MKKLFLPLTVAAFTLQGSAVFAADSAPVTLSLRSYHTLTNTMAQLADAAVPGSAGDVLNDLQDGLGLDTLRAIDTERPWQVAVWIEGIGGRPSVSLWVPTKNFDALKSALTEGPLLSELGENPTITANGDYAAVYLPGPSSSESAQAGHAAWTAAKLATVDGVLSLEVQPGDALRQQLLQGLGMVRMMMAGAVGSQPAEAFQGMDPAALTELLGLYLDVIKVGLEGWEKFAVHLDLAGDALKIHETMTALSGSELASWLQGGKGDVSGVVGFANPQAPAAFAVRWSESPSYMPVLKKLMGLSLQMQGVPAGSEAITETERLIDLMLPVQAAGTADFEDGLAFAAVYEFPGRDTQEIYRLMTSYLQKSMQSQVGEGKPYKAITYQEGYREVAGQSVDRLTMELNLDAPMYAASGQREVFESMWPGGKMEFDYAIKGHRLMVASPKRLEALLATDPAAAKVGFGPLRPSTVLAARVNFLEFIPQFFKANPLVPEETRRQFERLKSQGTDVSFILDLDGSLRGETTLPLQLIRSVSEAL